MEEKAVCYYCATIYDTNLERCPLCRSTKRAENYTIPQRRERMTEEERKRRAKSKGGKFAAPAKKSGGSRKPILIAALVFLILAVLILSWFIADMVGWLPGVEDSVDRESQASVSVNKSCTELRAEPTRLSFTAVGQTTELVLSVNASCEDILYCSSVDPSVASVSEQGVTAESGEYKTVTFTVTAVSVGNTTISISCGNQNMGCPVSVDPDAQPTEDPNYTPELNRMELSFSEAGETVQLKITNLPEGATVTWMSADESVASVDAEGNVTAVGGGETSVSCDVNGSITSIPVVCEIKETVNLDGAHLERTDVSVSVGESFPLFLYNSKSEHIDDIEYIVDDTSICKVEDNYVTALSSGTTKVRVVFNDTEFVCIVRVS